VVPEVPCGGATGRGVGEGHRRKGHLRGSRAQDALPAMKKFIVDTKVDGFTHLADLGGNMTAVGASANVVVLGMAKRAGTPLSFWDFTKKGAIVTAITVVIAAPYLWLRYFVLA
jgi:hypothetical protein